MTGDLLERLSSPGPKRVLSLDGGGVRGALTISYLARIEAELRSRYGRPSLVLRDYFDLIGGTSTGALIATGLAVGMEVAEIEHHYRVFTSSIFGHRPRWRDRLEALYDQATIEKILHSVLGDMTMGDPAISTGLCIVTKRVDTGSTWPLVNHPAGRFFELNRNIRLRDAVRASSAAPMYFQPEPLELGGGERGAFVDGGVSMANNPALLLFMLATLSGYPFRWTPRADDLLLVSIGTGYWSKRRTADDVLDTKLWEWAWEVPLMLMDDATWHNQMMLQYLGRVLTPFAIDGEVGDLCTDSPPGGEVLTYIRYNVELERLILQDLGHGDLAEGAEHLRAMATAKNVPSLLAIGASSAARHVRAEHLPARFDI